MTLATPSAVTMRDWIRGVSAAALPDTVRAANSADVAWMKAAGSPERNCLPPICILEIEMLPSGATVHSMPVLVRSEPSPFCQRTFVPVRLIVTVPRNVPATLSTTTPAPSMRTSAPGGIEPTCTPWTTMDEAPSLENRMTGSNAGTSASNEPRM
ncbi:hypothetical protein WJ972_14795 [Achromobacter insuavis]